MATGFTVTGPTLLLLLAAAIVIMVFMISKLKIHPFVSLFAVAQKKKRHSAQTARQMPRRSPRHTAVSFPRRTLGLWAQGP